MNETHSKSVEKSSHNDTAVKVGNVTSTDKTRNSFETEGSAFLVYPENTTASEDPNKVSSTICSAESDTRLWIGNLDPRLREFHLLKMVQRYGAIENFDFLFHRTGPNIGLPRGYAFVTFQDKETAEGCLKSLDGTKVLDKHIAVRWAHQATTTFVDDETKLKSKLPALSMKEDSSPASGDTPSTVQTKARTISAIEAKLKAMDQEKETGDEAGSSSSFFYQYNKEPAVATVKQRPKHFDSRARHSHNQRKRPYRR